MNQLFDYLNDSFNVKDIHSDQELVSVFLDKFGVDVKIEGELYQFTYDQLAAKWLEPVTHFCRGAIARKTKTGWEVVALPFDKFFNQSEGHSGIHSDDLFYQWIKESDPYFMEKVDGSLGIVYEVSPGNPKVSTKGSITPKNVGDHPFTFEDLFWKMIDKNRIYQWMDLKGYTLLTEICTTYNRIVTKYPNDRIYLLAIRINETGEYLLDSDVDRIAAMLGMYRPERHYFKKLRIATLDQAISWVEGQSTRTDLGEVPEGWVVYSNGKPVAKIKNANYLALHGTLSDPKHTRKVLIEAFFAGNADDLVKYLNDYQLGLLEELRKWYIAKLKVITTLAGSMVGQVYLTQKDYAMDVMKGCDDKRLTGFFFLNKASIVKGDNISDLLKVWFREGWKRFEDDFKTL